MTIWLSQLGRARPKKGQVQSIQTCFMTWINQSKLDLSMKWQIRQAPGYYRIIWRNFSYKPISDPYRVHIGPISGPYCPISSRYYHLTVSVLCSFVQIPGTWITVKKIGKINPVIMQKYGKMSEKGWTD